MNAFIRMYPKINMENIDHIIETTPFLSDIRINFYKSMLHYRKELILDKIFVALKEKDIHFEQKIIESNKRYELKKLETELAEKGITKSSLDYQIAYAKIESKYNNQLSGKYNPKTITAEMCKNSR